MVFFHICLIHFRQQKNDTKTRGKIDGKQRTTIFVLEGAEKIKSTLGHEVTPTKHDIKDIIKLIKPLRNRGILLKRAEGGLLNKFLGPLIKFGLMLMNTEFVPLAKTEIQMSNQMMDRRERGIHGYIQLLQKTSSNQIQRKNWWSILGSAK